MKIPIPLAHLNDDNFSYLIYGWMAQPDNSGLSRDKKYRYFNLEDLNKNKISKEVKLSRPTVNLKLEYMMNSCDSIKVEEKYIRLYKTAPYVLIDENILKLLLKEVKEKTFRFYIALLKYQKHAKNGKLFVSLERIADEIGLSKTNLSKVAKHHEILAEKGFIYVEQKRFSGIKTKNFYTIFDYNQVVDNRIGSNVEENNKEKDVKEYRSQTKVVKIGPIVSNNKQKKPKELKPIDMNSLLD